MVGIGRRGSESRRGPDDGEQGGGCKYVVVEMEPATGTRLGEPSDGVLFAQGRKQAAHGFAMAFLNCAFPSIDDDAHIAGPSAWRCF